VDRKLVTDEARNLVKRECRDLDLDLVWNETDAAMRSTKKPRK